jgi:hypothetical protein
VRVEGFEGIVLDVPGELQINGIDDSHCHLDCSSCFMPAPRPMWIRVPHQIY